MSSPNKPEKKIIYSFVSDITKRSPLVGMQKIYDLAHKHSIPVSWIVNLTSVKRLGTFIQKFHEQNGDELVFQLESNNPILDNPGMEKKRPNYESITDVGYFRDLIRRQKDSIRNLMPWAKLNIANLSIKTPAYLQALKDEGFEGIWGICWNHKNLNGIDDYGAPFGLYKVSNDYRIPLTIKPSDQTSNKIDLDINSSKQPLIAFEKTFRDINRGFFTGRPDVFCIDTDLIQFNKICTPNNVRYWKYLVQEYISNLQYNDQLFLIQHEPSHNMEFTVNNFDTRLPIRIDESEKILDSFFDYIAKTPEIRKMNLEDALKVARNMETIVSPKYTIFKDHPIPSREYQIEIRTRKYLMKYHVGTLKYALRKLIQKVDASKAPIIWPSNGKNFPPLFIFQNEYGQLYFDLGKPERNLIRPVKQIRYVNQKPTDKKCYPVISNYRITRLNEQNRTDLEIEIKVFEDVQWGILFKGYFREFEIYTADMKVNKTSVEISKVFPDFVFLYFQLKKNIPNRFVVNLYDEK